MELVSTSAYPKHKHATNEKKINVLLKYVPASAGLLEAVVTAASVSSTSKVFSDSLFILLQHLRHKQCPSQPINLHFDRVFSHLAHLFRNIIRQLEKQRKQKKTLSQSSQKNVFPASWDTPCKTFSLHLRFKNHLKFLRTFEQTIEQPQEETLRLAAIFVYLYYCAVRRLNTRN